MKPIQYSQVHFDQAKDFPSALRLEVLDICICIFPGFDGEKFSSKIADKRNILVTQTRLEGKLIGFKLGYEKSPELFYSWLGAVMPEYRRKGIARKLISIQHTWCKDKAYRCIQTKTTNKWKSMLILNIQSGYDVKAILKKDNQGDKILLEKKL